MKCISRQLRDAGREQFSKRVLGILAVQLLDLTPHQLIELANRQTTDPNGLQTALTEFFTRPGREHMLQVVFRSHGQVSCSSSVKGLRQTTVTSASGPVYVFKNKHHPAASRPGFDVFSANE
jgi:hypothetical protein